MRVAWCYKECQPFSKITSSHYAARTFSRRSATTLVLKHASGRSGCCQVVGVSLTAPGFSEGVVNEDQTCRTCGSRRVVVVAVGIGVAGASPGDPEVPLHGE